MENKKNNFVFGLISGVAIIAVIGFIGMSIAYFNKAGAQNATENNLAIISEKDNNKPTPSPSPTPTPKPTASKVNIAVSEDDHIRGNINAPVTIVEYSDFQCPYCSRFHNTMLQVMEEYPNDVRWVYRHFPLSSIHPYARKAALASECASEQGKFWEYADALFENQKNLGSDLFGELAKDLNLNTNQFDECLSSEKYADKIDSSFNEGKNYGVTGTPGSFINGQKLGGAVPFSTLQPMIEDLLN